MENIQNLWRKLLIVGKLKFGWKTGLSVPFIVGAYLRKYGKDYASKDGLRKIFDEIIKTIGDDEIAIEQCTTYKQLTVYIMKLLSDIPKQQAWNSRQNPVVESKVYTTIEGVDSTIESLVDKLWEIHKEQISKGEFSAYRNEVTKEEKWQPFNEDEEREIEKL